MQLSEDALTNHEVTICLKGGAVLGPFNAAWSKESSGDVRALSREYDEYLMGQDQSRFKFHLHDTYTNAVHTLILRFENVTAIYDHVKLRSES
ncbi:hypothetical protein [Alkalimarinus sediminis]|uniref:Uncharacterized protein n=1 Tax=Alkalimarinus sediminis TaxID=1632866 RepID=A0A9E8HHJ4_9ALTE|nr:hypothetical protein [Alkalimarinus sediminis]UZW74312.1 hypothetical protein NNL22_14980 [Alkalimarinus sediminis]